VFVFKVYQTDGVFVARNYVRQKVNSIRKQRF
jgi:hypothetical protein